MNRSYSHIKHLLDSNNIRGSIQCPRRGHDEKREANQLDDRQCHAGFNYYEYYMPKFGAPGC